jgi:putative membrane protein
MAISAVDRARVGEAIRAAEQGTSAEIVCVLARASSDYATMPLAWSIIPALALPWALVWLTQWPVARVLLAQLALFAVLLPVLSAPAIRVALTPRRVRRQHAHQAAAEQFLSRGLTRTTRRTGVLIFVSLAERYARIVADEGVAEKVPQAEWQAAVDALVARAVRGETADGLIAAVEACGAILAKRLPAEPGEANELPDRLFLI